MAEHLPKIDIKIDNRKVSVAADDTILSVARKLDIPIPTMCYMDGYHINSSCMVCVVHELKTDKLIPACSAPVAEGMEIETCSEKVIEARKDTLEMLMSEHVGDCEAPCHRACPANMNIPLMNRQIEEQNFEQAIITVKNDIALPAVLGRICSAPCENGCNRGFYDSTVSICHLKRFVADVDLAKESPYRPELKPKSGKKIAVIGAGPAGLAAAYYLVQKGHDCIIYDQNPEPGGLLRYGVPEEKLPRSVLDREIQQIFDLGVEFRKEQTLGKNFELLELQEKYDALVLTMGTIDTNVFKNSEIKFSARGIIVNRRTFETSVPSVFVGGNIISEGRLAIRSAAHGKQLAFSVDQFVNNVLVTGPPKRFNSMMGKIREGEGEEFIKEAKKYQQFIPDGGFVNGYSDREARQESSRCFSCDCRKLDSCKLRNYCEEYKVNQSAYKIGKRQKFEKIIQHDRVIYEPGKCIKCNLCIQITQKAGEKIGLTFVNRGFEVRVEPALGEAMDKGLEKTANECIDACPTAALARRERSEE